MEYVKESRKEGNKQELFAVLHLTNLDKLSRAPAETLDDVVRKYSIPTAKQVIT
jgi:hypothetical protein